MGRLYLRVRRFCLSGLLLLALLLLPASSYGVTTGKISGTVRDKSTGEPLPAAAVRVAGTTMGALADEKGQYFILNVPPGTYTVQVNVIGYVPLHVQDVKVNVDLTTFQDFEMEPTVLEVTDPLIVMAERTMVDPNLTASRTLVTTEEVGTLPINTLTEILMTTAGSFAGNLRGGRPQDQQITMDGALITKQVNFTGPQDIAVNPYMIQEIEVRTGTYNVEHPSALSGIVTVTTREGGDSFSGNLEFRTLGQKGLNHLAPPPIDLVAAFRAGRVSASGLQEQITNAIIATDTFNADPARQDDGLSMKFPFDVLDTTSSDPGQWTARFNRTNVYWDYDRINPEVTGAGLLFSYVKEGLPLALANSRSLDRSYHPGKYNAYRRNNRTEKRPVQLDFGMGGPLGDKITWFTSGRFAEDWGRMPNEYHRTMNFYGKLSVRPTSATKVSVSGLIEDTGFFSGKGQRDTRYDWRYNAEGMNQNYVGKLHGNLIFTHTLNADTFYEVRLNHLRSYTERYNPRYGRGPVPDPLIDANITAIGYNPAPEGIGSAVVSGDQAYSGNFHNNWRPFVTDFQFNITSQVTPHHQFKAGASVTLYDYQDSRREWNYFPDVTYNFESSEFFGETNGSTTTNVAPQTGVETRVYPYEVGLFAQDRVEYGDLVANVGLRLDAFNANANGIDPFYPRPGPDDADGDPQYRMRSPSVKYAVSPRLGLSHPVSDRVALHYSYGVFNQRPTLDNLYAGLVSQRGGVGNPDLPYQKSTNYEMGVQGEVYPGYYLDVTGYFRDVDMLPVWFTAVPNPGFDGFTAPNNTAIFLPRDGQDARGVEISARKQMSHRFSFRANYTLSFADDLKATKAPFGEQHIRNPSELQRPPNTVYRRQPTLFDRRHRLVTNVVLALPLGVTASVLTMAQSGNIFRSTDDATTDALGLLGKSSQAPWTTTTDLFLFKNFDLGHARLGLFTEIRNLFNRRNIYDIGSDTAAERWIIFGDPVSSKGDRFSGEPLAGIGALGAAPRDIFVGLTMSW